MKRSAVDPATALKNFFRQRNLCFVGETVGDPKSNLVEGRILDLNDRRPMSCWQKFLGLFSDAVAEFRNLGELQTRNYGGRTGMVLMVYGRDWLAGGKIIADKIARILRKPVAIELVSESRRYLKIGGRPDVCGKGPPNLLLACFLISVMILFAGWLLPIARAQVGESFFFLALLIRFSIWFLFGV